MLPAGGLKAEELVNQFLRYRPAGSLEVEELVNQFLRYWPATSWVHYTTSCKHSLGLLKMGEIIAQNMLS
jgi:hypothetical protein